MRVAICGATGFIGSRLTRELVAKGIEVSALTRNIAKARRRLPAEVRAYAWNPLAGQAPPEALDGVDAVVNLAGETIAGLWTKQRKRKILESRVTTTHNLVESFRQTATRPHVLVNASAAGYYGDRGDEPLDEGSGEGEGFLAEVCAAWEAEAQAAEAFGVRVVRLRSAIVLSQGGGLLQLMQIPFRLGLGGWFGHGRQWMPWIHLDDEVGLIHHALEVREVSGPLNSAAPEQVTNRQFAKALGKALRRPVLVGIPAPVLRLVLGEAAAMLLGGQRVTPRVAGETGYHFRHPELAGALGNIFDRSRS